ncbi:hypothetical protein BDK51DRAFT_25096, partial [Blyttiomyces helicus]
GLSIVFAKKKDSGVQICFDHRGLNSVTKQDQTLLPSLFVMCDGLAEARYFILGDIKKGGVSRSGFGWYEVRHLRVVEVTGSGQVGAERGSRWGRVLGWIGLHQRGGGGGREAMVRYLQSDPWSQYDLI